MFYSHEILTSRKHGVATVWLVATLGSKSMSKKVTRRAILDVDVTKACETILAPEAPMALRLQSHLMYGVSRVYSQQCGYVLADAQHTQNNMRTMLRVVKAAQLLDPNAGKTRPDQLTLQDDPAFLPDLLMPDFDFDISNLDVSSSLMSQSVSSASPYSQLSSRSSIGENAGPGLIIPTSDTIDVAGGIGGFNIPDEPRSSVGGRFVRDVDHLVRLDEDTGFLPDVDFEFDAEGNVVELGARRRDTDPQTPQRPVRLAPSSTGASSRVRREHFEGQQRAVQALGGPMHLEYDIQAGEELFLPQDVEPFPATRAPSEPAAEGVQAPPEILEDEEAAPYEMPLRRMRRGRQKKVLEMDNIIEVRNADLARWSDAYIQNMAATEKDKQSRRYHVQAMMNASFWVFGAGIGGVGQGLGSSRIRGPFDTLAGDILRGLLLGNPLDSRNRKRPRERHDGDLSEDEKRRSRLRRDFDDQVGRAGEALFVEDGTLNLGDDEGIEFGREGIPAQDGHSSLMPWNIGSSAPGSRQGSVRGQRGSSIVGGFGTSGPNSTGGLDFGLAGIRGSVSSRGRTRRGSRLLSASPLLGRGHPGGLDRLSSLELPAAQHGDDDDIFLGQPDAMSLASDEARKEFELFGPAAAVDVQGGAESQVAETIDNESYNFLDFVKESLRKAREASHDDDEDELSAEFEPPRIVNHVTFDELLPPGQHSKIVAAQALLHTLSLATKNLISLRQERGFGEIKISILGEH